MARDDGAPSVGGGFLGPGALVLGGRRARLGGGGPEVLGGGTPADVAAVLTAWRDEADAGGVDRPALAAMMEQFPDGRD